MAAHNKGRSTQGSRADRELDAKILDLLYDGWLLDEVSHRLNVAAYRVKKVINAHGSIKKVINERLKRRNAELRKLAQDGATIDELAFHFDVSEGTVVRILEGKDYRRKPIEPRAPVPHGKFDDLITSHMEPDQVADLFLAEHPKTALTDVCTGRPLAERRALLKEQMINDLITLRSGRQRTKG